METRYVTDLCIAYSFSDKKFKKIRFVERIILNVQNLR